jgi:hypothetical protein
VERLRKPLPTGSAFAEAAPGAILDSAASAWDPRAHAHGAAAGERLCDDDFLRLDVDRAADRGLHGPLPGFFFRNAAAMANHASTRDLRPVGEGTDDLRAERFANDSPLEGTGFEPSVPLWSRSYVSRRGRWQSARKSVNLMGARPC